MAPRVIAYEKPKLIARAIAKAAPNTEPIPFFHLYEYLWALIYLVPV